MGLLIRRKKKEAIQVGDDVRITVLDIRADQVKLLIQAPREIRVLRAELLAGDIIRLPRA